MKPSPDILDPYAVPRDEAAKETAIGTHFSPGTGWRLLRLIALVIVALGLGFFFVSRAKTMAEAELSDATRLGAAQPPTVDVVTASLSPAIQSLSLPGETAAWDYTTIYARVNGYVAKWFVDIGDHVKAGQTLATIDTPDIDAELLAAKAKLNASVAQTAVKQARADFAKTTDERWRESPKGVVSDQERESKKAASAEAIAELNAARAQVMLEQADVDRLSALTQFKEVKAPFDGTIVQRQIDMGDLVTAGSTANTTSLYRLVQDDPMRVFVHAPQSAAAQLMQAGATATIVFDDQPGSRFEGKVTRTAKAIDPQSRTLRVEIDVPNPRHALVPGMYVQVNFKLAGGARIQVPAAALLFRSGGPQVAVIDANGAVAFRDVAIASDDGNVVTIGSGLAAGDRVALNLSSQIAAGEVVKPNAASGGDTRSASSAL
jgi:RND family efflux transporter MFP subunit